MPEPKKAQPSRTFETQAAAPARIKLEPRLPGGQETIASERPADPAPPLDLPALSRDLLLRLIARLERK